MNPRYRMDGSVESASAPLEGLALSDGVVQGDGFDDALTAPRDLEPALAPAGARDGLRILLVDDHDDMLAMMHMYMSRRNYAVATASSGHQALELVQSFAPHIVVSDIAMPGMDGYEMMLALRATDLGRSFKSIALSGYDMADDRDKAHAAGYDAHLAKPVDFDVLFDMIDRLVTPEAQVDARTPSTD